MFTSTSHRRNPRRPRVVHWFAMLMFVLSLTPAATSVMAAPAVDPVQEEAAPAQGTGSFLEVHVAECDPGTTGTAPELRDECHDNGLAGVKMAITSVDPALGINQPEKTTIRVNNAGPGLINTGEIPAGDYRVDVDLPDTGNTYVVGCEFFDREEIHTGVTPTNAETFTVTIPQGEDIVCDLFVIPQQDAAPQDEGATLDFTVRWCDRNDLEGDDRSFEQLTANCTDLAAPPTAPEEPISMRIGMPGGVVNTLPVDAEGKVTFEDLPDGDYPISTNVDLNDAGQYLFCEYTGQPRYDKTFDPATGATTFTNLLGEEISCDLFVVYVPQEAARQPAAPQEDLASFEFTVTWCERTDLEGDDRSYEQLSENCTTMAAPPTAPAEPISIRVGMPDTEVLTTEPLDAEGKVRFEGLPDGDYTFSSTLNLNNAGQYLFCEYEGQDRYQKQFDTNGVTTFTDMQGEDITCEWFAVYVPQEGEPAPPTKDDGSITLDVNACPQGYNVEQSGNDAATFAANCGAPVADVVFSLANSADVVTEISSNAEGAVAFTGVAPDDYRLWSQIPLESATEYVFCDPGDGVEAPVNLTDRGVAAFTDFDGSAAIECSWYVVPENLRGEETGATVTVHLAACPNEYAGDQYYADCHANGVADMEYVLDGPNGELTATTSIPASPGPGVATFTELPAGEYTLRGGPPLDFGSVVLYCSDPATNQPIEATMEGGIASFTLAEQQSILCDWYFLGENASGIVTPTPEPSRAEILVTLFTCDQGVNTAGATFSDLDSACQTTLDDVTFSLGAPGGTPITAATGLSGPGAVRFYDLQPADYVMTPKLPAEYASVAVYCDIDGGDVYQKSLQNGATTFVNVNGEEIRCSWFTTKTLTEQPPAPAPAGPTGSITVREFLCEKERGSIEDWERECVPGSNGTAFTLASSDGAVTRNAAPNDQGILVFAELPDGYYELTQDTGIWCRAAAERVDSRSRVIVRDGGNTDVFIYECGEVKGLPDTGTGSAAPADATGSTASYLFAAMAVPALGAALWHIRRTSPAAAPVRVERAAGPADHEGGSGPLRFR